jgi:hypothetical protein
MTPASLTQLRHYAARSMTLLPKDARWPVTTELQRAGLVRVSVVAKDAAKVEITSAGLPALTEAAA